MDNFTILDGGTALLIIISALLAYSRGVVRELIAIGVWFLSGILAFSFATPAGHFVGDLPVVSSVIKGSCQLEVLLGFSTAFAVSLGVLSLFAPLVSSMLRETALDSIDRSMGFLFGALRGVLLVVCGLFVYATVITQGYSFVDNSQTVFIFGSLVDNLTAQDTQDTLNWMSSRYSTLLGTCDQG